MYFLTFCLNFHILHTIPVKQSLVILVQVFSSRNGPGVYEVFTNPTLICSYFLLYDV